MVHNDRIALYYSDRGDLAELPESCLQGTCAYFMKKAAQRGRTLALDPLKARDGCMVFGTVRDPMRFRSLPVVLLYQPMLKTSNKVVWGAARCAPDGVHGERRCFLQKM